MSNLATIASDKHPNCDASEAVHLGISSCLLGQPVRYNGGHKQSKLCLELISQCATFESFCPEVAAGFGTPRPTMRLVGNPQQPTLVYSKEEGPELTSQLVSGFENKLQAMGKLDGYILMKNSPSCGLDRIKVYQPNGHPHPQRTAGIFAKALQQKFPLMPIEEEGRLNNAKLYDNFLLRVYAYKNFRNEVLGELSISNLMLFHRSYKYLLMAHDQNQCRALGRLIGAHVNGSLEELADRYFTGFIKTLSKPASRKNHTNAMFHILGYLKKSISAEAKEHIVVVIESYNNGLTPLPTPLTLLKHYLMQHGSDYINEQRYLEPYPEKISPMVQYP